MSLVVLWKNSRGWLYLGLAEEMPMWNTQAGMIYSFFTGLLHQMFSVGHSTCFWQPMAQEKPPSSARGGLFQILALLRNFLLAVRLPSPKTLISCSCSSISRNWNEKTLYLHTKLELHSSVPKFCLYLICALKFMLDIYFQTLVRISMYNFSCIYDCLWFKYVKYDRGRNNLEIHCSMKAFNLIEWRHLLLLSLPAEDVGKKVCPYIPRVDKTA